MTELDSIAIMVCDEAADADIDHPIDTSALIAPSESRTTFTNLIT